MNKIIISLLSFQIAEGPINYPTATASKGIINNNNKIKVMTHY